MYKSIVAGAALALAALSLESASALAGTRIGIAVGEPWPVPHHYPGPVYDPGYPDDEDAYDDEDYVSCREGAGILRDYGFHAIRPVRCGGDIYRYQAVKRYRLWSVRVSARSGRIIGARVIGDEY